MSKTTAAKSAEAKPAVVKPVEEKTFTFHAQATVTVPVQIDVKATSAKEAFTKACLELNDMDAFEHVMSYEPDEDEEYDEDIETTVSVPVEDEENPSLLENEE